jgi:hypothetical protein
MTDIRTEQDNTILAKFFDKRSLEARRKLDKIGQELILKNNRLEL